MKKITLLLSALLIAAMSFAQTTVTFDADTDNKDVPTAAAAYEVVKDGITMSVTSGMLGEYNGEKHYRIYKNQTLTLTSTVGNIVSVEFTCTAKGTAQYGPGCFTAATGEYTYADAIGTWKGETPTIVFTAATNQVRASQIVVTVKEADPNFVAPPTITGTNNFEETTEVTIEVAEGLEAYYTLDGTEPTKASTKYTAAFTLSNSTTVKAIAYDPAKENTSDVTTKYLHKITTVTCAEAAELCATADAAAKYIIRGYVTEIAAAWDDSYKNISFWMADTKEGGKVLQAFRAKPVEDAEKDVKVGDYVEIIGTLTMYGTTPEVNSGGKYTILEKAATTGVEDVVATETVTKFIKNGQIYIIKGGKTYNALGAEVK